MLAQCLFTPNFSDGNHFHFSSTGSAACLHLVSLSLLLFTPCSCQQCRHSCPERTHFRHLCHPLSQHDFMPLLSLLSSSYSSLSPCVCLRLADRHAGPAAGGSSPHPALLPRGAHLAVLQLQESLLQTGGCHALLCRYGNNFLQFLIKIIITVRLSGRF